jgi:hypothetical protein
MGAYGMGRNWESLTDGISYVAGDIVGGAAGTQAENYRDSVLKMTENTYLAGGGTFRLPGTGDIITAMTFPAMMDTSLGQGALQIFTAFTAFSNNSPPDRATWAALTYPIQTESLKGNGSLGQNSTIDVNSDTFFRSGIGVGSLVLARRDFVNNSWGNKPISNEMQRILSRDNESLLSYSSAVDCDNRFLITCAPNVSGQGVFHIGLVSLNFDLLSSLRGDLPPSWEGVWTGVNTLQAISGRVNGSIRDFSFTFNMNTNRIELWEFLPEGTTSYQDNDTTPIDWVFESPVLFNKDVKPLAVPIQLNDGEVYLSDIKGKVHVKIQYRPDFYPCWTDWREFDVCAADTVDEKNPQAGYRMRIGLGQPKPDPCEAGNNRPLRNGYFFQFRITVTGYCQWRGMKVSAIQIAEPKFAPVECSIKPCQVIDCAVPDDLRVYSLQGLPPEPLPPVPPPDFNYSNSQITNNYCPGSSVSFTGSLPSWLSIDGENLIVAAGAFKGMTQIGADNSAQTALANFIATNVANGSLTCGTPSCDDTNTNNYGITGYYDGLIANPDGDSSVLPTWDGTFKILCGTCSWGASSATQGGCSIQGKWITCATLSFDGTNWNLTIWFHGNLGFQELWAGIKSGSQFPDGVYSNNGGTQTTPATLTISQIAGTATSDSCSVCHKD